MRNLIVTSCLILFCGSVYGQVEVWACQTQAAAGLNWDGSRWTTARFMEKPYLIRLDGENSTYSAGEKRYRTVCTKQSNIVRCNDTSGGTILLNIETGTGGISEIFGVLMKGAERDSLSITTIQCTKF